MQFLTHVREDHLENLIGTDKTKEELISEKAELSNVLIRLLNVYMALT